MEHSLASMHSHHNTYLVVLSYVIATMSAYVSIDLARRVMYSSRTAKYVWLIAGAGTLGIGIWSMHFIAMLAFQFPVPIYYDTVLVVLSVLIAIVGCFLGFTIISRNTKSSSRFILSGIIMGLSIAAMHYVGMAAVKPVTITYNLLLVIVSIVIAISASWVAIGLGFRSSNTAQGMPFGLKAVFSLIMAVAIAGMHYTGMAATQFSDHGHPAVPASDMDTSLLAWIVAGLTVLVFTLFFFSLIFDRVWKRKEILQKTLLDSIADGIVITDQSGRILHVNPAFLQLAGGHLKHTHLQQYHPGLVPDAELLSGLQVELNSMVFEVKRRPVVGEALHQSLWLFHDLTERIQNERQITYMAYHDALTQLPNRHRVDVVLNEWMASTQSIGCIILNVDRMKFINDMLGHQAGDLLLQHIAERLSDLLEEGDFLARFGGDEFIILVANDRVNAVEEIAKRCVEQMRAPFIVHGHPISITLSAGLCTYPREASNADELLQYADLAMSESKRNGKNEATAFTLSLNEQYRRKLQIEEALTTALSHGELHLVYQPKIRMRTEEIEGVEALLRWTHPEYGPISPVEFIPIAEEKGLIHTIGEWVLRASCLQWVSWSRELAEPPIVAVNISPIQLTRDDFLPTLLEIIEETAMDPRYLELEITESASLGFEEKSRALLEKIRTLGIHISLDDFGTGYSSFSHLKELPIDVLKIDRSFLRQLIGNKGQEAIVRSIIHLGHNLNFRVLVEGAEKKEEVDWLREAGCDFVQGYYYSKPEMPERILQLMRHEGQPHG